jgi:hypothetical protein
MVLGCLAPNFGILVKILDDANNSDRFCLLSLFVPCLPSDAC